MDITSVCLQHGTQILYHSKPENCPITQKAPGQYPLLPDTQPSNATDTGSCSLAVSSQRHLPCTCCNPISIHSWCTPHNPVWLFYLHTCQRNALGQYPTTYLLQTWEYILLSSPLSLPHSQGSGTKIELLDFSDPKGMNLQIRTRFNVLHFSLIPFQDPHTNTTHTLQFYVQNVILSLLFWFLFFQLLNPAFYFQ